MIGQYLFFDAMDKEHIHYDKNGFRVKVGHRIFFDEYNSIRVGTVVELHPKTIRVQYDKCGRSKLIRNKEYMITPWDNAKGLNEDTLRYLCGIETE